MTDISTGGRKLDAQSQYWVEAVECALDEAGVTATDEQILDIAAAVEGAHECYGMAFYQPSSHDVYGPRLKELERKLAIEKSKTVCPECVGRGYLTSYGPYHSSTSSCFKCNGEGKVVP